MMFPNLQLYQCSRFLSVLNKSAIFFKKVHTFYVNLINIYK